MTTAISELADATASPSTALVVRTVPSAALAARSRQSVALPPYIAPVTADDPDADGDDDRGTIVDTFA